MKWYYKIGPMHTSVRVFISGALAGTLTFRNGEFTSLPGCRDALTKSDVICDLVWPATGERMQITMFNESHP